MLIIMTKERKVNVYKMLKFISYIRRIFGLQIILNNSKKSEASALIIQRTLASIWFIVYIISTIASDKIEFAPELHIKSTLIVKVLPTFITIILAISTCLTIVFTHVFLEKRIGLVREVLDMDSTLNFQNASLHPRGANLIPAIAVVQIIYIIYWFILTGPINFYKTLTTFEYTSVAIARFVSLFFLIDYFTANAVLLQQYITNNEKVQLLQTKSLLNTEYPENERIFREQIRQISERHRKLCIVVKETNKIYGLQLLLNIALQYGFILVKSYVSIYAILFVTQVDIKIKMVVFNSIQLILHGCTLLLLVETTTRLCQEVCRKNAT